MRGDVKGGMPGFDAFRGDAFSLDQDDFVAGSFLDDDLVAGGQRGIKRRIGGGHIKRDVVILGQNGERIRPDFVGGIAVGGDAVGADDDGIDEFLLHQVGGHVVGDEGAVDAVLHEFPSGEPGALQVGPGFVDPYVERGGIFLPLVDFANDAEGRPEAAGGQGAGVAVCQDVGHLSDCVGAVYGHGLVHGDIFAPDLVGLGEDGVGGFVVEVGVDGFHHAFEGPEEIDGRGAGFGESIFVGRDAGAFVVFLPVVSRGIIHPERGGDSDGGGASHEHLGDGVGNFGDCVQGDVAFGFGQGELVEKDEQTLRFVPAEWADIGVDHLGVPAKNGEKKRPFVTP